MPLAKKLIPLVKKLTLTKLLLFLSPICLFLSYHPVISLGQNEYMNIELSVAEIWLFLFAIASISRFKTLWRYYGKKPLIIASLLPTYFTLSAIWSANHFRAILTAGIFWLIVIAGLNIIYLIKTDPKVRPTLERSLLISATLVSVFCILQCVLDLLGVSPSHTLLCRGCVYTAFGFPHPNGFAIEPQFMGNLLLAPALLGVYLIAKKDHAIMPRPAIFGITFFIIFTLFITFSRGAIYAFILGFIVELILLVINHSLPGKRAVTMLSPILLTFSAIVLAFMTQGIFAQLSPTSDNFLSGITKSVHQLTLGKVDLRSAATGSTEANVPASSPSPAPTTTDESDTSFAPTTDDNEPASPTTDDHTSHFSGYVAESTNVRLNLNGLAIGAFTSNPRYFLIGTGLGSAGIAIHNYAPTEIGPKEIIQNEYLSLLLETGIIGYALLIVVVVYIIRKAGKTILESPLSPLFLSVLLSFAFTLLFFSGLPNAIHLYLFPLIFIGTTKHHAVVAKKV